MATNFSVPFTDRRGSLGANWAVTALLGLQLKGRVLPYLLKIDIFYSNAAFDLRYFMGAAMHMSESVAAQLERNRFELLDLSTRNRLLNTPRHSKHAKTVGVVDETSSEIFRLMVRESKSFTFLAGKEGPSEDQDLAEDADPDFAPLPNPKTMTWMSAA